MNPLQSIRLAGFKSIRDQTVELRKLNVLIGANGSGKSNFIAAFRFLHDIVRQELQISVAKARGANRLLHRGVKVTREVSFDLRFLRNAYRATLSASSDDSLFFSSEVAIFHRGMIPGEHAWDLGRGHVESNLVDAVDQGGSIPRFVRDAILSWKVYHFHDTSSTATIKQKGLLSDDLVLQQDAGNLAAFLFRLQRSRPDALNNICETFRLAAPFFAELVLDPDIQNGTIQLRWRERGSDLVYDADSFSDGTLRFLCLATLLLQPNPPTTILLDEPELGLHPAAICVLADLLSMAANRTQLVVATQSVPLIDQLDVEDLLVTDREDGASVFRRPNRESLEAWLEDYSLGEIWEKNLVGGRP